MLLLSSISLLYIHKGFIMATLTISHHVYLSREDRYKLHNREDIEAIGVSVPVLFDKGNTSEPAREVFCRYKLTNNLPNRAITTFDAGYCINLPQLNSTEDQDDYSVFAAKYGSSERLLDIKDGGVEYSEFKQYHNAYIDGVAMTILHYVEIKDLEYLIETIT
jgi:hypothetical protein